MTALKQKQKSLEADGFRFIGWLNDADAANDTAYKRCKELDHPRYSIDDNQTCDHVIACDVCKIYWKYDSGD